MFFDDPVVNVSASDALSEYPKAFNEMLEKFKTSFTSYVANVPTAYGSVLANLQKDMIGIDTTAKNIVRSMGGVADFAGDGAYRAKEFRDRLVDAEKSVLNIGGTMKDVGEAAAGLAEGMGRMINPSAKVLSEIVAMGKAFGITTKESAKMVTDLIRFGGTQSEALETMRGIANEARKAGVNTETYMKAVQSGLKASAGFGFKNGIEGLKNMAKQASMLRTTIESIGAKGLQSKVLDPEGAIATAAGFQMLGGAIGKLGDPFQLLYMAQSDMEGLQNELVKSTSSAFKFNKETGKFDASTQDLYRLRQQAELTGGNFDDMLDSGREFAKLDYIKNAVDLSTLNESQQGLITSLAQIDKNGKVTVDIPGYDEIDKNTGEIKDLATLMKEQGFKDALEKYQSDEKKTTEQIALDQMDISQKQLTSINTIQRAVILSLSKSQQQEFINQIESSNKNLEKTFKDSTDVVKDASGKIAIAETKLQSSGAAAAEVIPGGASDLKTALDAYLTTLEDGIIPSSGSAPIILKKGAIYKGLKTDDVAVGEGLGSALSNVSGGNMGGKLDININLTGSIDGDSGQLTKMFNSPQVQKQIMDTVLYKLNDYKRQQGVLS